MALLQISNLQKNLGSGENTFHLSIPTFSMNRGEQVLLEGRSGTGKSTFLNCIAGIVQVDSGSVVIENTTITELSEAERDTFRAKHIGYIFQTFNLLQGFSALENVLIGSMFSGDSASQSTLQRSAIELLGNLGLGDKLSHKPSALSVGQQQRVAVARALIHKPKLILADEPTANLDAENAGVVIRHLQELSEEIQATLIVVSHDRDVLPLFSQKKSLSDIITP